MKHVLSRYVGSAVVLLSIVSAPAAHAADPVLAKPGVLPTSLFYSLDLSFETVQSWFAFGNQAKFAFEEQVINERLAEINQLISSDHPNSKGLDKATSALKGRLEKLVAQMTKQQDSSYSQPMIEELDLLLSQWNVRILAGIKTVQSDYAQKIDESTRSLQTASDKQSNRDTIQKNVTALNSSLADYTRISRTYVSLLNEHISTLDNHTRQEFRASKQLRSTQQARDSVVQEAQSKHVTIAPSTQQIIDKQIAEAQTHLSDGKAELGIIALLDAQQKTNQIQMTVEQLNQIDSRLKSLQDEKAQFAQRFEKLSKPNTQLVRQIEMFDKEIAALQAERDRLSQMLAK